MELGKVMVVVVLWSTMATGRAVEGKIGQSLSFYLHNIVIAEADGGASAFPITRPHNTASLFGLLAIFDSKLTITPNYNSMEVGRGRGFYAGDSMSSRVSFLPLWTAELELNGKKGTLCFFGQDEFTLPVREVAVFGCGGIFKGGPEIATICTANTSAGSSNFVLKFTVPIHKLSRCDSLSQP